MFLVLTPSRSFCDERHTYHPITNSGGVQYIGCMPDKWDIIWQNMFGPDTWILVIAYLVCVLITLSVFEISRVEHIRNIELRKRIWYGTI